MPTYDYECIKCGVIEVFHGILEKDCVSCPVCGVNGLKKLLSFGGGVIIAGREANQYNDVRYAKYWRDKNGIRHEVKPGDGYSGSATVKQQTATPEEIKKQKVQDARFDKNKRVNWQIERQKRKNK